MFLFYEVPHPLKANECRVSLIAVIDIGLDAEGYESAHATYAQDQFLLKPVLGVATVKIVGDGTVLMSVLIEVGIKQVQSDLAYRCQPDAGLDGTARPGELYCQMVAVGVLDRFHGNM